MVPAARSNRSGSDTFRRRFPGVEAPRARGGVPWPDELVVPDVADLAAVGAADDAAVAVVEDDARAVVVWAYRRSLGVRNGRGDGAVRRVEMDVRDGRELVSLREPGADANDRYANAADLDSALERAVAADVDRFAGRDHAQPWGKEQTVVRGNLSGLRERLHLDLEGYGVAGVLEVPKLHPPRDVRHLVAEVLDREARRRSPTHHLDFGSVGVVRAGQRFLLPRPLLLSMMLMALVAALCLPAARAGAPPKAPGADVQRLWTQFPLAPRPNVERRAPPMETIELMPVADVGAPFGRGSLTAPRRSWTAGMTAVLVGSFGVVVALAVAVGGFPRLSRRASRAAPRKMAPILLPPPRVVAGSPSARVVAALDHGLALAAEWARTSSR